MVYLFMKETKSLVNKMGISENETRVANSCMKDIRKGGEIEFFVQ